jgi:pimeloyl-ACP methyl ester carboxylesterase
VRRVLGVTLVVMVLLSVQAAYAGSSDYDLFFDRVKLRPGLKCDIHMKVFVNEDNPVLGETVLAVPGGGYTAQSWDEYAEALFADPHTRTQVSQVVALDLPGRGYSQGLIGIPFGEVLVDDDAAAILAALDCLRGEGIYPGEILGQCSGALEIQMAQERLVQGGSSLFQEYGISRAVLLSPSLPAAIWWHMEDAAHGFVWFLVSDSELGWHFNIPAEMYLALFFSNLSGELSPDAPAAEEIDARGYRSLWPLFWALQIFGETDLTAYPEQPFFLRPEVSPGIFGLQSGTVLHVVSYVDDPIVLASQATELFGYLVGDPSLSTNTVIDARDHVHDRVHNLHISNPSVIIKAMRKSGALVW